MGSGTWEVKVGVFPARAWSSNRPGSLAASPLPEGGVLGSLPRVSRDPRLGRDRVKRLSSAVLPRGRRSCGRALSSSFPGPIWPGYGGHPRPSPRPHFDGRSGQDARFQRLRRRGGWRWRHWPRVPLAWQSASWGLGGRRARRTHCSPLRAPSPRARRGGRVQAPAGSRCVEVGALLSSRFVLTSAHSRNHLTSYGASPLGKLQKKCFPTFRESLHQRGMGVGTQNNLGVARTMEIKGEWPLSDASGTSVCILKPEPSLLPKLLEKCLSLLEGEKNKQKKPHEFPSNLYKT